MGLAPPTPYQWQVGDIGSAALLNAQLYNGLTFLEGPPDFVGVQTVVQSLATSTWTAISLDSTVVDTYGGHSNTTNNNRYTCQQPGWYTVCGVVSFAYASAGGREASLAVNGTRVAGGAGLTATSTDGAAVHTPTRDVYLNLNDYVDVRAIQDSGGALNTVAAGELACALWVRFSHV